MSGFLRKLQKLNPLRRIDERMNEEVEEKATVGTRAVLKQVDVDLPKLTAILSGERVRLGFSGSIELSLTEEDDEKEG
jgi:hypothetical protein